MRMHPATGAATALVTVVGLAVALPATASAAAARPRCDGEVATIVGTARRDDLAGTPGRDVIVGLGGDDRLRGLGGDDVLCGGPGRDRLEGGEGADRIFAGRAGVVRHRAGTSHRPDSIDGGSGDDYLDIGPERVDQRTFDVTGLIGFGYSPVGVTVDLAAGTADGFGHDTIVLRPGLKIFGSTHDDVLLGGPYADVIVGSDGDDLIDGRGGGDLLDGEEGRADAFRGVSGDDTLVGGEGDDVLTAWRGRDDLEGGPGDDRLTARTRGASQVRGGDGNDSLVVTVTRPSGYVLDGGPGRDVGALMAPGREADEIDGRVVEVRMGPGTIARDGVVTGSLLGVERVGFGAYLLADYHGTDGPDDVRGPSNRRLRAWTYGGDDVVRGSRRADYVDGGGGRDKAFLRRGDDTCVAVEVRRSCEHRS